MNRRQKIIISVTGIFLVLLILVGLTYAYFLTQIQGNEETRSITVTTAKLELVYSDNTPEVTLTGIIPITTDKVKTEGLVKKFTISKTEESSDIYTTIKLSNLNVSENIALYDMKWALYQGDNPISTGDFGGKTEGEIVLATNQEIKTTTGLEYSLHIWINETGLDQSSMMNGTVSGKLEISGLDKPLNTLASVILKQEDEIYTEPTFLRTSTDRGLFVQQGDITKSEMGFPTYYFKGSATNENEGYRPEYTINNYVQFGTYKNSGNYIYQIYDEEEEEIDVTYTYNEGNPILWRIVRINEDGSIKLITEEVVGDIATINADPLYIKSDGTDSDVKNAVETWYNEHLGTDTTLDSKVVKSSFCNDVNESKVNIQSSVTWFAGFERLSYDRDNISPIFTCSANSIIAYEKAGLITGDELTFAGGLGNGQKVKNNPTYLNKSNFLTMTPMSEWNLIGWDVYGLFLTGRGGGSLRAAINIIPTATVTYNEDINTYGQPGTITNPYIIN